MLTRLSLLLALLAVAAIGTIACFSTIAPDTEGTPGGSGKTAWTREFNASAFSWRNEINSSLVIGLETFWMRCSPVWMTSWKTSVMF